MVIDLILDNLQTSLPDPSFNLNILPKLQMMEKLKIINNENIKYTSDSLIKENNELPSARNFHNDDYKISKRV